MSSRKFALVVDVFGPDQECLAGISEPWLSGTADCSAEFLFSEEFETAEEALEALATYQVFVPDSCVGLIRMDQSLLNEDEVARLLPVTVLDRQYALHQFTACGYFSKYPLDSNFESSSVSPTNFAFISGNGSFSLVVVDESESLDRQVQVYPGIK
jgi:hypothetical protein